MSTLDTGTNCIVIEFSRYD